MLDPDDFQTVASETAPSLLSALRSAQLSDESTPGALLVAAWSGSHRDVHDFLGGDGPARLSEALLRHLTRLLLHLEQADAGLLVELLAQRFGTAPAPLLTALAESPVETACELWDSTSSSVLETLNSLELPEQERSEEPAQPTARQAAQPATAPPAPPEPEPTGDGVALLAQLIETATDRADGEPLVSKIFATYQISPASDPLISWTYSNADRVVAPMESPVRRAHHAILGIKVYSSEAWAYWGALLPDPPRDNIDGGTLTELASTLVREELLPAFRPGNAKLAPDELADLTNRVAVWSSLDDDQLAESARSALADMAWPDPDQDAGKEMWAAKKALYRTVLALAGDLQAEGRVATVVIEDLSALLDGGLVDGQLVEHVEPLCEFLPSSACVALWDRLDVREVRDGEEAAVLGLRLLVRRKGHGHPLAASELLALEQSEQATVLSDAWLKLDPSVDEAVKLVGAFPFTPGALGSYGDKLDLEGRTALWVASAKAGLSDPLLQAVGRSGVGPNVVEHCRAVVAELPQEPKRNAQIRRLSLAQPATEAESKVAVRKAAALLARDLLARDVSGDVRSAAEVMLWAGGAAHGTRVDLREQFDRQVKKHKNALTKALFERLQELGLVTKKKSLWDKVFGETKNVIQNP